MNTPARGGKPSQPARTTLSAVWSWPEWMGLSVGLALAVFYRATFAEGPTIGTISNFLELKWAAVALAGAGWALGLATGRLPASPLRPSWIDLALAGLTVWALLSLAWTPDLAAATLSGLYAGIAILLYLLARSTAADTLIRILLVASAVVVTAGLATGLALWAVERLGFGDERPFELAFGNENFASETLVLCACVLPLAWRQPASTLRWLTLATCALAVLYLLLLAPSNLQYLALLAALWYLALRFLPARLGVALTIVLAIVTGGAIAIFVGNDDFAARFARLPLGALERVQVWSNVAAGIADAPLLGHGWGSFYHAYAEYIDRYMTFAPNLGLPAFDSFERIAGAGHNELLEIWFLLGLPGFLLAVLIVGLALAAGLRSARDTIAGWAGLGLVAWLAMAMIEFPGQNAASAALALLFLALVVPASPAASGRRTVNPGRILPIGAAVAALALALPALVEVHAQNRFAAADLLHKAGRLGPSADAMGRALAASSRAPKLRLRLYPQSIVAGLPYWNQTGIPELERHYAVSASAAPHHPVLLDLRLKFLLALTNPPPAEVESALVALKVTSGLSNANAYVLEAAWALRTGDRARAEASLTLAESRLAANPIAVSASNNRANITALHQQLNAGSR